MDALQFHIHWASLSQSRERELGKAPKNMLVISMNHKNHKQHKSEEEKS